MRRSLGIDEGKQPKVDVMRMRRRHLRGVMAIERQVYPRPWSPNLFIAEMNEDENRAYFVAKVDRELVGYAGMICYGEE
jgi:ribosomal-protein-alanine N-acetyltransferase